jgi:hypothetical protein
VEVIQGYPVIGDDFRFVKGLDEGLGYIDRDYESDALGADSFCVANSTPTFSMSELIERIKEKTAKNDWITDKCDAIGFKVKNQSRSNYCWNHAPVRAMELAYILQGGDVKILSAFWGAAQIKRGRNQGGWGIQACRFLHDKGVPLESFHPPMNFSVNNDPAVVANAKLHQLAAWNDLEPSDQMAIYSKVVLDQPVTVGIPAWTHEVCLTKLLVEGNEIIPVCDNSHGTSSGNNGRVALRGRMKRFSEAGAIASVEPASE